MDARRVIDRPWVYSIPVDSPTRTPEVPVYVVIQQQRRIYTYTYDTTGTTQ